MRPAFLNPASARSPQPRRRFQFSLRTLMLVVVPLTCLAAWLGNHYLRAQQEKEAIAWVRELHGTIHVHPTSEDPWDRRLHGGLYPPRVSNIYLYVDPEPARQRWPDSTRWISTPGGEAITIIYQQYSDIAPLALLTDLERISLANSQVADLSPLAHHTGLVELDISGTQVEDITLLRHNWRMSTLSLSHTPIADFATLAEFRHLRRVYLAHTSCSDLSMLAKAKKLERLDISHTAIADLTPLAGKAELAELNLRDTPVTDLTPLSTLTKLETLDLRGTLVTDLTPLHGLTSLKVVQGYDQGRIPADQFRALQAALPDCEVKLERIHFQTFILPFPSAEEREAARAMPNSEVEWESLSD